MHFAGTMSMDIYIYICAIYYISQHTLEGIHVIVNVIYMHLGILGF